MIDTNHFIKTVKKEFQYLIQLYSFEYIGYSNLGRNFVLFYTKKNMIIEIKYNFPNEYFDINIYCKTNSGSPYYWENLILGAIFLKKNMDVNLDDVKFDTLDEIIAHKASLLKKYGDEILSGKEWYSWKDVANLDKQKQTPQVYLEIDGKVILDSDVKDGNDVNVPN